MDVDMLKTSPSSTTSTGGGGGGDHHHQEHNMDILTMMMQIEKLQHPDFFDPNLHHQPSDNHHQQLQFSTTIENGNLPNNNFYPQTATPNISIPPFMGTPIQEQSMTNQNNSNKLFSKYPPLVSNPTSFISSMEKKNSTTAIREMIFRIAAMQPIHIDPESVKPPKRRNVKISKDPQSVAARHRRERISERIRILQRLVPGGTKMDTASMLDEAIHYVKFLKKQVQSLEQAGAANYRGGGANSMGGFGFGSGAAAAMANFNLGYNSNSSNSMVVKTSSCTQRSAPNMVTTMQMLR